MANAECENALTAESFYVPYLFACIFGRAQDSAYRCAATFRRCREPTHMSDELSFLIVVYGLAYQF